MAREHLAGWTGADIKHECVAAYKAYRAAKTEKYRAYFRAHEELLAADHPYKAKDLPSALPDGWEHLSELLPKSERHLHHLSGNSSQVLALGLLGVGSERDASLRWLWKALGPLPSPASPRPSAQFERKLAPETLNEQPRQTSIDFFVDDPAALLCIECKWTEEGMGGCGCPKGAPGVSSCSDKVRKRKAYWNAAKEVLHLPERVVGNPCPLSFTYQAVRNVAAAQTLALPDQQPVFGLIYDAENPYFSGCGTWPGWAEALETTINYAGSPVRFASASWQELLPLVPLDVTAACWAAEKHGFDEHRG